jgi:protein gp37
MNKSKIEWTDYTWNPWSGCKKCSAGCDNCYMYRIKSHNFEDPEILAFNKSIPKFKPQSFVFVCSMSDFFYDDATLVSVRENTWRFIHQNSDVAFIILTKRPQNIERMLPKNWGDGYKNVILGITAEDSGYFNNRWNILKQIPSACYLVSHEPALGFINFSDDFLCLQNKAWVIAGGETGVHARPSHVLIFQKDLNQCQAACVPFFFKHWGEWMHAEYQNNDWYLNDGRKAWLGTDVYTWPGVGRSYYIGRKNTGNLLNGNVYQQTPFLHLEKQQISLFE